jgi:hypothetical protein
VIRLDWVKQFSETVARRRPDEQNESDATVLYEPRQTAKEQGNATGRLRSAGMGVMASLVVVVVARE